MINDAGVTSAMVAHRTLNPLVLGSSPRSPISFSLKLLSLP